MTKRNRISLAVAGGAALVSTVAAAQPRTEDVSGGPVTEDDLAAYHRMVSPEAPATPPRSSRPDAYLGGYWDCNAWPASGIGVPTYWISTNLAFARYQALSSCSAYNGYVCLFECTAL